MLESAEQRRLLEKWLYDGLTDEERARCDPALIERAKSHFRELINEGLRSAEKHGWVDGKQAMRRLRDRIGR